MLRTSVVYLLKYLDNPLAMYDKVSDPGEQGSNCWERLTLQRIAHRLVPEQLRWHVLSTVFAQVVDRDLENTPIDECGYASVMPEVTCQRGAQFAFGHESARQTHRIESDQSSS